MKTPTICLLAVAALTLTHGTRTVRADDTRSLATSVTAPDGKTVLPYFWTENNDAQLIAPYMLQASTQQLFNPQRTASQAYFGIGLATMSRLAVRALD